MSFDIYLLCEFHVCQEFEAEKMQKRAIHPCHVDVEKMLIAKEFLYIKS